MRFRKPTLLTVILGLVCLAILLTLGSWQLDRRAWKAGLIATIDQRMDLPAAPLPAAIGPEWTYRRVTVQGDVVPGSWFRFPGRAKDGKVGDLLMLLIREPGGRLVLAEQDFVGFGEPLPPLPATAFVEGVLRQPSEPGLFTPDNDPAANHWYVVDPQAMAANIEASGQGPVLPLYVVDKGWRAELPNNHLQYALTWFSFAVIFIVIFALFHRRRD